MFDAILGNPTYLAAAIGVVIVVVGLLIYGFRDLRRFSFYRAWAVAGVAFREGVRRRVLWVTPLAMLAVVLLIQLGEPRNEVDAIRQAAGVALFASGLVAIIVPLVLSCTSLPREVDSRVIFTVVTKPLTRLELLLGKLMGFARLSGLVLLIMGIFSFVLLWALEARLIGQIESRLTATSADQARGPYLQHLAEDGLLRAERLDEGDDLQIYAVPPDPHADDNAARWALPLQYYVAVPFRPTVEQANAIFSAAANESDLLQVRLRAEWRLAPDRLPPGSLPIGVANLDNLPDTPSPGVQVQVLDAGLFNLISPSSIQGNAVGLPRDPEISWEKSSVIRFDSEQTQRLADQLRQVPDGPIYIAVWGLSPDYHYGIGGDDLRLELVDDDGDDDHRNDLVLESFEPSYPTGSARGSILFRTYLGTRGIGISGPEEEREGAVGVLAYRGTPAPSVRPDGTVGFEFEGNVERTGGILDEGDVTRLQVQVVNATTGFASPPQIIEPETGRRIWFTVPAQAVAEGDFDLRFSTISRAHIVSVRADGIRYATGDVPYVFNLLKALLGQWLLSILVAACGLAFSTFVSWPIAVVLTLGVLSGRWVADQLGTAFDGRLGRGVVQQMFGDSSTDAAAQQVVETGFNALGTMFTTVTRFLPPLASFDTTPSFESGISVEWSQLGMAALVMIGFGLPLMTIAYVVVRNKEVAP